ncbi:helix-turn-helix domain-containing protein [Chloroflexota bacterium]
MEAKRFGERLRELRKKAGLSQRVLAVNVGVDFSYLSKLENGVLPPPSEKVILRLAEILGTDKDELLTLAGRVPSDIRQMLQDPEALQLLRSENERKKAKASKKKKDTVNPIRNLFGGMSKMERPRISASTYKGLARVSLSLALVIVMGVALFWYTVPSTALEVTITPPTQLTLGGVHTFTSEVTVTDPDIVPIDTINMYIYKSDDRATYEATLANLPGSASSQQAHTVTPTGSGSAQVTAVTAFGWQVVGGTGYAMWEGTGYSIWGATNGYAYGYGGGSTSITYTVQWTSPTSWPAGSYVIETDLVTTGKTFTETSAAFTLGAAGGGSQSGSGTVRGSEPPEVVSTGPVVGPSTPRPTTTVSPRVNVRAVVTGRGVFTERVAAQSKDRKLMLAIEEGTTGLTAEGVPLSEISVSEVSRGRAPAPPKGSSIIGLPYDLGPDGATFDPPATITFTYDPASIPEGVSEESLTIAFWDVSTRTWVEIECTVDPATNTITARVSHFTLFTIMVPGPPAPAPAPAPAPLPTPAPAPPVAPESAGANWWMIGSIIAAVIIAGGFVWMVIRRRKV